MIVTEERITFRLRSRNGVRISKRTPYVSFQSRRRIISVSFSKKGEFSSTANYSFRMLSNKVKKNKLDEKDHWEVTDDIQVPKHSWRAKKFR